MIREAIKPLETLPEAQEMVAERLKGPACQKANALSPSLSADTEEWLDFAAQSEDFH